jgi:DHA3 family macrolide efflux protein-like MFS transporter
MEMKTRAEPLWTRSFALLWQGQLVSILGDAVYAIALGFWLLARTGSTALMGSLMAVSLLPRILVSPVAGVVVDRVDRRRLMIAMDLVRGAAVVLVAAAALAGALQVWMVFAAGILIGLCGAFFTPASSSAIPDIAPRKKLVQANSLFGMLQTGGNVLGNSAGGILLQAFGAPLLFLVNGISYLFSAGSLLFIRVPAAQQDGARESFLADLRAGFRFVWGFRGMRAMLGAAAVTNFFASMGIVLFLPLFQQTPGLGPARYGIAMACFNGGLLAGMALAAVVRIEARRRFAVFAACGAATAVGLAAFPHAGSFPVMVAIFVLAGLANGVMNVFIMTTVQLATPAGMRGKVFALLGMLFQGLMPLAFALGGIAAEMVPVPMLITACFAVMMAASLPFACMRSFREFVCYDGESDSRPRAAQDASSGTAAVQPAAVAARAA